MTTTMDSVQDIHRWLAPAAVILCVTLQCGCGEGGASAGEAQFLARRVETLEEKVRELERKVDAPRPPEIIPAAGAGPARGSGAGADTGSSAGSALLGQLGSEEDRANLFLLKVKQLQAAPRTRLPQLIAELGIDAPEIGDFQKQIAGLEQEKGRLQADPAANSARLAAIEEEIDKLRFRLEIAAEGVRSRLIEEGRELSAKVEEMRSGAERADGGAPAAGSDRP